MTQPTEEDKRAALDLAREYRHFEYSIQLLERNFAELDSFLARITYPPIAVKLLDVTQRWRLHDAMLEVTFQLHNYVASAQSLVEHTRVLYRHLYKPKNLFPEYQPEINKRFVNDPLTQFVQDFRDMAQHYSLPNIAHNTSFTQGATGGSLEVKLLLQRDDLRRFSGWTAPAKKFLEGSGDTIDIRGLVRAYHEHVLDFYQWFRAQQGRVLGTTFEFASRLQSALFEVGLENVLKDIEGRLASLEADEALITPTAVRQVLLPSLTLQEERDLAALAEHLPAWISGALRYVASRRELPGDLEARLKALITRADG